MNYYDELITKIEELINAEQYEQAKNIIDNELTMAYIPRDIEEKLKGYLCNINLETRRNDSLDDEKIEKYLFLDDSHQLLAVDQLNNKNLRDYIDLCNKFLISNGNRNAKALLIDSLIRQEINEEINLIIDGMEYHFIPKYIIPFEQSDGYLACDKLLSEFYLKDPSKLIMAKQLLFKEAMLNLPINIEKEEAPVICDKITKYIEDAFNNND